VDDTIGDFLGFMRSPANLIGPGNIGDPCEFTMGESAEVTIDRTGSAPFFTYLPSPRDDPRRGRPDTSVAKRELGWTPEVGLREGLGRTVGYFEGFPSHPRRGRERVAA
jgi:UDP-glucuronate decarboxylase